MSTSARLYRGTPRNLSLLARALQRGELVAVPTETVYGLAGNALDARACGRIFKAKGRPTNDPLIVHIHALAQLDFIAQRNPAMALIARAFWPGPLTLVLPKKNIIPDLATSGLPSVAVRMPAHPLFRELLQRCALPLAAPSANPFGYISPTSASHVRESLGKKIRYILDGGDCEIGLESTILDLRDPLHPAILRPGAISARDVERVLKVPVTDRIQTAPTKRSASATSAALAPGMLTRHYSPRTPITLHHALASDFAAEVPANEAVLHIFRPAKTAKPNVFWLSEKKLGLTRAARSLFASLRQLDAAGWAHIHVERATGTTALACAINDRLSRAAAKR